MNNSPYYNKILNNCKPKFLIKIDKRKEIAKKAQEYVKIFIEHCCYRMSKLSEVEIK